VDSCSIVYFGDGATSQGDVNEAYVFAASTKAPVVFFLQNNHWAISVPVTTQSPSPLVDRPRGFGIPSVRVDGNDVLASYTASVVATDHARSGQGPAFVEADTYRIGAHTSSDDPSRYREDDELAEWVRRDPISRSAAYLRSLGVTDAQLAVFDEEGEDIAADVRRRTVALAPPSIDVMFQNVYREPHPTVADQQAWLERYEAGYEGGSH
ncbi:pyruvate dehydrogenase (acetyl-transferring) E1 component subunit alpha, partial [Curtobacterium sp. Csp2]